MLKHRSCFVLAIAIVLLVIGCGSGNDSDEPEATPTPRPDESLQGEWILSELYGEPALEVTQATLSIDADDITGYSGCNNFGFIDGSFEEDSFDLSQFETEEQGCPRDGIGEQEDDLYTAFGDAEDYELRDNQLDLLGADGEVLATFDYREPADVDISELDGTSWRLISIDGEEIQSDSAPVFSIDDTWVEGFAGCREFELDFHGDGDEVRSAYVGMDGDIEVCSPDETDLENHFIGYLGGMRYFDIQDGRLHIFTRTGNEIAFEAAGDE